jgi:hypothetical protein
MSCFLGGLFRSKVSSWYHDIGRSLSFEVKQVMPKKRFRDSLPSRLAWRGRV